MGSKCSEIDLNVKLTNLLFSLYDHKKPDTTKQRPTFKDYIRKRANNPEIYRNYKIDRREVMGDNKKKGEAYLKKLADEHEMTVLKAIYSVEGTENLDKAQKRKLRLAGVIKKRRNMYGDSSEEALEAYKLDKKHKEEELNSQNDLALSRHGSSMGKPS